ncbi:histidine phosphatase family protein [Streptomyces sp. 1331.2]|uniref:histidine phosphatase family protein n=1 Tax=Streptomyces sp. 1331.2 TaxID=1938835 RepID=UPI000BC7A3B5|nr:histidine phosphatase family protein [Streptomyces sp. 1331.2]SOB82151.1 Broad specificity phosphatase PhoE [Streptomyces sp. 1331.2]
MAELGTTLNGKHQSTLNPLGANGSAAATRLPSLLIATRHGESTANVEFQLAEATGALSVPISCRDADIPLSRRGRRQARALGRWWAELPGVDRPRSVWCSPYLRTAETARVAIARAAGLGAVPASLPVRYDERLRDRELGILEMLPRAAIEAKYPEEAARRRKMGELYYRPPGGESWADVALRVRSLLRDVCEEDAGRPVLLVAHDCTVLMLRYALDRLDEAELTALGPVHNCSTSLWRTRDGRLRPDGWNGVDHLTAEVA